MPKKSSARGQAHKRAGLLDDSAQKIAARYQGAFETSRRLWLTRAATVQDWFYLNQVCAKEISELSLQLIEWLREARAADTYFSDNEEISAALGSIAYALHVPWDEVPKPTKPTVRHVARNALWTCLTLMGGSRSKKMGREVTVLYALFRALYDLDCGTVAPIVRPTDVSHRPSDSSTVQALKADAAVCCEALIRLGASRAAAAKRVANILRTLKGFERVGGGTVLNWRRKLAERGDLRTAVHSTYIENVWCHGEDIAEEPPTTSEPSSAELEKLFITGLQHRCSQMGELL
jgi:hypothetical protein